MRLSGHEIQEVGKEGPLFALERMSLFHHDEIDEFMGEAGFGLAGNRHCHSLVHRDDSIMMKERYSSRTLSCWGELLRVQHDREQQGTSCRQGNRDERGPGTRCARWYFIMMKWSKKSGEVGR
jgi:hypothetical protein